MELRRGWTRSVRRLVSQGGGGAVPRETPGRHPAPCPATSHALVLLLFFLLLHDGDLSHSVSVELARLLKVGGETETTEVRPGHRDPVPGPGLTGWGQLSKSPSLTGAGFMVLWKASRLGFATTSDNPGGLKFRFLSNI